MPSIDALAQDLDLDELLILHKAWADWFSSKKSAYSRSLLPLN
jgi:hypothetical protein